MDILTENELIAKYKSESNSEDFEALITPYKIRIASFVRDLLYNKDDEDDALQETIWKVSKQIHSFDLQKEFKCWLFAIARNTAIDIRRKRKYSLSLSTLQAKTEQDKPQQLNLMDTHSKTPLQALEEEETKIRIYQEILILPEKFKEIILLRHFHDYSYKEICEFLGITQHAVETRLFRARLMLKNKLKDMVEAESNP